MQHYDTAATEQQNDTFDWGDPKQDKKRWLVTPTTTYELAGFWRRTAAIIVDTIILNAVAFALLYVFSLTKAPVFALLLNITFVPYYVFMTGFKGATLGKMLTKIRVVMGDGTTPGYGTGFVRYSGWMVFLCLLWVVPEFRAERVENTGMLLFTLFVEAVIALNFLWMLWDKHRQTLSDKMARTFVVKTRVKTN